MQNHYLQILNLKPGASKKEVKSAYRRLSKVYHPDINKSEHAKEKFIAINEAYKFLSDVGPAPGNETTTYNYDSSSYTYETWRKKAQSYAQEQAKEAARMQNELIKKILFGFNILATVILCFNILLLTDLLLPNKKYVERIEEIKKIKEPRRSNYRGQYTYFDVRFTHHRIRANKRKSVVPKLHTEATVFATPIFDKARKAEAGGLIITQAYGIYDVFGWLILIVACTLILYKFVLRLLDHKLTLALFTCILFAIQLHLFFSF